MPRPLGRGPLGRRGDVRHALCGRRRIFRGCRRGLRGLGAGSRPAAGWGGLGGLWYRGRRAGRHGRRRAGRWAPPLGRCRAGDGRGGCRFTRWRSGGGSGARRRRGGGNQGGDRLGVGRPRPTRRRPEDSHTKQQGAGGNQLMRTVCSHCSPEGNSVRGFVTVVMWVRTRRQGRGLRFTFELVRIRTLSTGRRLSFVVGRTPDSGGRPSDAGLPLEACRRDRRACGVAKLCLALKRSFSS